MSSKVRFLIQSQPPGDTSPGDALDEGGLPSDETQTLTPRSRSKETANSGRSGFVASRARPPASSPVGELNNGIHDADSLAYLAVTPKEDNEGSPSPSVQESGHQDLQAYIHKSSEAICKRPTDYMNLRVTADAKDDAAHAKTLDGAALQDYYPLLREDGTLPMKYIVLWGFPTTFFLALFVVKLMVMKRYYTDEHDANLGYMSVFLTVSVIVDAFTDPAMANNTDNSRTKYGRRRPWLVVGAILSIPVFTLSYKPLVSDGIPATIWYGIFHIGSKLVDTVYMIPHDALGAELTPEYHGRSLIFMVRTLAYQSGIIVGALLSVIGAQVGYAMCAFALSVGLTIGTAVLCVFSKERSAKLLPAVEKARWSANSIVAILISTVLNRPFFILSLTFVIEYFGTALPYEILPFMMRGVIGEACLNADVSLFLLALSRMVTQIIFVFFWLRLSRRVGKYRALLLGTFVSAIFSLPSILVQRDEYPACSWFKFAVVCQLFQGFSTASVFLVKSLLSDIVDYDELLSGHRREAMYMMAAEFLPKFSQIPAQAMLFYLMSVYKYQKPGDWQCYSYQPGEDAAWCGDQRAKFLPETRSFLKFAINSKMIDGSETDLCGSCASNCCTRLDPYQNAKVIWLFKCGFCVVPSLCLFCGCLVLLFYPKDARSKANTDLVHRGIRKHRRDETVADPWFPEKTLPPVPSPTEHFSMLMHFWPWEVRGMLRSKKGADPDYKVPQRSCLIQLSFAAVLAGVGILIFILGWDDLQDDLGGSYSPIGAMLLGVALLIFWFNRIRYQAARELEKIGVTKTELCRHFNYLCRFTGYPEVSLAED